MFLWTQLLPGLCETHCFKLAYYNSFGWTIYDAYEYIAKLPDAYEYIKSDRNIVDAYEYIKKRGSKYT